jgi:hypothetical protein
MFVEAVFDDRGNTVHTEAGAWSPMYVFGCVRCQVVRTGTLDEAQGAFKYEPETGHLLGRIEGFTDEHDHDDEEG